MPPQKDHSGLYRYSKYVRRQKGCFPCPTCSRRLLAKQYETHCRQVHLFNAKLGCVWCQKHFWKSGSKCENMDHILPCSKAFLLRHHLSLPSLSVASPPDTRPPTPPLPTVRRMDGTHPYPEHDAFGIPHSLPPSALVVPWLLKPIPFPPLFRDDALNRAAAIVRTYLQTHDDWLHVMVKANAYASFQQALDADAGITRCLPFACWCNGGSEREARHRQHRHLICVSPPRHFYAHVWPRVTPEDRPGRRYPCKRYKRIASPLHLVNTLGYVSHRTSRCTFSFDTSAPRAHLQHFHLHTTLPRAFRLPLVLLWEGGLEQLLHQQTFRRVTTERLLQHPLVFEDRYWRQQIRYCDGLERGLVLPVRSHLFPTPVAPTDAPTFHLMAGRRLWFVSGEELDEGVWLQKQVAGGNCFYDAVLEDYWVPRQQRELHIMKPLVDGHRKLGSDNSALRTERDAVKTEVDTWKRECDAWKRECAAWRREAEALRRLTGLQREKMDALTHELKELNRAEMERLKRVLRDMATVVERLKEERDALKKEVAGWRQEREARENQRLKGTGKGRATPEERRTLVGD